VSFTTVMSKSPLRFSMGGGGTDVAHYYEKRGGAWTSATISLYVRGTLHVNGLGGCIIKYSDKVERVSDIHDIQGNDLMRETLLFMEMDRWQHRNFPTTGIEINTFSDAPSRSGLGVSGAMTVGLLQMLHMIKDGGIPPPDVIAAEAYEIEHNRAGSTGVGWQDQLIAAHGGIATFEISTQGEIVYEQLQLDPHTVAELQNNLILFGTKLERLKTADQALKQVHEAPNELSEEEKVQRENKQLGYLDQIKAIGQEQLQALRSGQTVKFGALLDEHWQVKTQYAGEPAPEVAAAYKKARHAGALGGKIIGASTQGSFMFFYCPAEKAELRKIMESLGMTEIRWQFDFGRSHIAYMD